MLISIDMWDVILVVRRIIGRICNVDIFLVGWEWKQDGKSETVKCSVIDAM